MLIFTQAGIEDKDFHFSQYVMLYCIFSFGKASGNDDGVGFTQRHKENKDRKVQTPGLSTFPQPLCCFACRFLIELRFGYLLTRCVLIGTACSD